MLVHLRAPVLLFHLISTSSSFGIYHSTTTAIYHPSTIHPSSSSLSIIHPCHHLHHSSPGSSSHSSSPSCAMFIKILRLIGLGGSWIRLWLSVEHLRVAEERTQSSKPAHPLLVTSMLIIHPCHLHHDFCMCQWPQVSSPSSSSSCLLFKTCSSRCIFLHSALPAGYGIFKTFLKIFFLQCWVGSLVGIVCSVCVEG